jgi:hypothetical protein
VMDSVMATVGNIPSGTLAIMIPITNTMASTQVYLKHRNVILAKVLTSVYVPHEQCSYAKAHAFDYGDRRDDA